MPSETIELQRSVTRRDVERLDRLAILAADENGILRPSEVEPSAGVAFLKFGLGEVERDELWERIRALLRIVDAGELLTF